MAWRKSTRITVMLAIDVAFFLLELAVGLLVGSLALLADAFHMLNDIISLLVGLWAVKAAQKESSDRFSFGWLRAEILGAFFNAVFLIALCVSILLEAITRFFDPPEIPNPKLILIVGSLGLLSNGLGFLVLGGHGHSHGGGGDGHGHDHGHSHDSLHAAEEGHYHTFDDSSRQQSASPATERHNRFTSSDEDALTQVTGDNSLRQVDSRTSAKRSRTRTNSIRNSLIADTIYPPRLRQHIIDAARQDSYNESGNSTDTDDADAEETIRKSTESRSVRINDLRGAENAVVADGEDASENVSEHSPLLMGKKQGSPAKARRSHDSAHRNHNHNKPKKSSKGHGHNHDDMGMRAMVLHVIGDALGNVGVIVSALVIWLTHSPYRFYADPIVSLFITLIILQSTIPLTKASAKILLQATPDHLDVNDIKEDIMNVEGVVSCHHVHIWQLSDSQIIASMHIQVSFPICVEGGRERYMLLAREVRRCLHAYGIHSATIQPEFCTDNRHDHALDSSASFDGPCSEDDACLLGCVDDCKAKGCCTVPGPTDPSAAHGEDVHSHDHDHEHDHEHDDDPDHGHIQASGSNHSTHSH